MMNGLRNLLTADTSKCKRLHFAWVLRFILPISRSKLIVLVQASLLVSVEVQSLSWGDQKTAPLVVPLLLHCAIDMGFLSLGCSLLQSLSMTGIGDLEKLKVCLDNIAKGLPWALAVWVLYASFPLLKHGWREERVWDYIHPSIILLLYL